MRNPKETQTDMRRTWETIQTVTWAQDWSAKESKPILWLKEKKQSCCFLSMCLNFDKISDETNSELCHRDINTLYSGPVVSQFPGCRGRECYLLLPPCSVSKAGSWNPCLLFWFTSSLVAHAAQSCPCGLRLLGKEHLGSSPRNHHFTFLFVLIL